MSTANMDAFQVLLAKMRGEFLTELPERCGSLDDLIMALEKSPDNREVFNELFRGVHSLKGSGGTHGLSIITTICHQLENLLTDTDVKRNFNTAFATRALAYLDLLRRVETIAQEPNPNYGIIEADLENLRQAGLQSRKTGLIVESSPTMAGFYKQVLETLPVQLSLVDNGMTALGRLLHEHFDFVIVGREIKELNGIALMVAVRAAHTHNQDIPAILVSSKLDAIPDHAGFSATLMRDQNLANNLIVAIKAVMSD